MKKMISLVLVLTSGLATEVATADFIFGDPESLGSIVNSSSEDIEPSLSNDGLTLLFSSNRPGGLGGYDIWVTKRATLSDPWGPPENLGSPINQTSDEFSPCISSDGLSLYFADGSWFGAVGSTRPGGMGEVDIWMTNRPTVSDPWGPAVNLGSEVNTNWREGSPSISADGLSLFFQSNRPGGKGNSDLWVSTRVTVSAVWDPPTNLGSLVNSNTIDAEPCISPDGLVLLFGSYRTGDYDLWMTRRKTKNDPWQEAVNLGTSVNSSAVDTTPCISHDGSSLFFFTERATWHGNPDLWQVPIINIVDLNGDGIVDSADMCVIVNYWGTDELLCDIGPMPWGDGIVDVQDLIVLAEHLFEEVNDPTLVAHWPLDEAQGSIAYDNAGTCDGALLGDPIWQPSGGMVAGALQFHGVDDYVSTPFVLNPADGAFSVVAWIKGGAPGQVIISQTKGFAGTWLGTDSSEGKLMTGLSDVLYGALESESVITDGQWHRVGLVYDLASHRHLYVDGVEVAVDSDRVDGVPSNGGLHIGAAKDLDAGSFFSGLIDDVRIYNRALRP